MNRATENITATETHFVQRYVASEKTSSYVDSAKFAAKISNKKRESSEAFVSEKLNKYESSSAFVSEKNKNRTSVLDYDKVDALASVFEKHNKKQEVSPNLIPEKGAKRSSSGIFTHSNTSTINSEFLGGAKRSSSGIFSFFKWFKKSESNKTSSNLSINDNRSESSASSNNDDDASDDERDVSKSYALSRDTSAGSVDTLFSTATVASFTYVPPTAYKPFGSANVPEKLFQPGPETDTHRNRMKLLDKHRERDKNLTLRKKYRLFTGETSSENKQGFNDYSLPLVKTKSMDDDEKLYDDMSKKHRRTVSDSSKDKKAGAYCHVKGKRKAPPPPIGAVRTSVNEQLVRSPNSTLNKKKRPAPPPPVALVASVKVTSNLFTDLDTKYANPTTNLTQEQKDLLISNISRLQNNRTEESDEENNGTLSSSVPDVVCNDSLKLEHGVLKPLKEVKKPPEEVQVQKIVAPVSPISPRPWYKRTLSSSSTSNRDSIISHHFGKKDIFKSKSVDEKIDDNFPMRFSSIKTESKFNMFSRFTSSDDRKENRKSNVSMLANISELDREAAAIVQKEQNREQAKLEAQNEKFYSKIDDEENEMPEFLRQRTPDSPNKNSSKFKKGSARELISRFNALTNVTKVTVNAALFPNKDESNTKRRFSFSTEQSSTSSKENISVVTPPMKRSIFNAIGYKEPSTPKIVEENLPIHKTEMKLDFEAKAAKQPIDISRFLEIPSPYKPNAPPLTPMDIQIKGTTKLEQQNLKQIELKEEKKSVGSGPGNVLESWICARCTLENERCRMTCLACNAWKPISKITNIDKYLAPSPAQSASHFYGGGVAPAQTKTDDCATAPALEENKTSAEDDKNKPTGVDKNASTTATNVFKEQNKNNATASTETENTFNDKNIQKEARTFAEHVFKQFETNEENNGANEKAVITSVVVIEPDMDEIRRARVARFSQNLDINDNDKTDVKCVEKVIANDNKSESKNDIAAPTPPNRLMTEEQIKLRKMLKEMKDSLPNKRKSAELRKLVNDKENIHLKLGKEVSAVKDEIAKSDVINMRNNTKGSLNMKLNLVSNKNDNEKEEKNSLKSEKKENLQTICEVSDSKKTEKETSRGAVPKEPQHKDVADSDRKDHKPIIVKEIPKQKPITQIENKIDESIITIPKQTSEQKTEDKIAAALIITQEITYENIKIKKENLEARKPIKVSSSVQTQAVVRQINSPFQRRKPPTGKSDDIILPIAVESQPSSKSVSRCGSFGKGTFELIRPKDFADISATNTRPNSRKNSTSSEGPPHTYANISEINDSSKATEAPSIISYLSSLNQSPASSEEELLSAKLSNPVGLQDFKATLNTEKQNVNTLAINRLLKRLEAAIAGGQHVQAAKLAKDLARLKVNCSVTRQKEILTEQNSFTADMYVEDQVSHQGPIPLKVYSEMTVGELKQKVMQEFDIPAHVQRWILGRQLATDDSATLEEYDVSCKGAPLFLYLVAPDDFTEETLKKPTASSSQTEKEKIANEPLPSTSKDTHYVTFKEYAANNQSDSDSSGDIGKKVIQNLKASKKAIINKEIKKKSTDREIRETSLKPLDPKVGWQCPECTLINQPQRPGCEACSASKPIVQPKNTKTTSLQNYIQLMDLDKTDLVQNTEPFECLVCLSECKAGEGVTLRECLHTFCRQCLANTVEYTDEAEVKCPYRDDRYSCDIVLQQREIKALVSKEVYEQYLARSIAQAENKIDNAFHCKTPDCKGWCIFEDNVNEFKCPVCRITNCLTCQAIHEGLNCKQYQEQMAQDSETNADARRTREMLNEMVACGEAMACPSCQVVLMKKWGCDWLRCSMCKTEICWVTRGPRWGPGGKGDTSGGCQCGVNGIKCHPKCTYCH